VEFPYSIYNNVKNKNTFFFIIYTYCRKNAGAFSSEPKYASRPSANKYNLSNRQI